MVDIRREGCSETQGEYTQPATAGTGAGDAEGRRFTQPTGAGGTEAGTVEWRRHAVPGESAPVQLLVACAALAGKAQNAGAAESALLWNT